MKELITRNPYTLEQIHAYPYESHPEVLHKIKKGRAAFEAWQALPVSRRVSEIRQALTYFDEFRDRIARDITDQMGKPLSQSKNEVSGFFERANYLCEIAEEVLGPDILPKKTKFTRRIEHVPLGVVFVIAAWNYPLLIAVNGVLTSLLAGNTVLLKHAGLTPAIGEHFQKAFIRMGGRDNVLQHCIASHDVVQKVIEEGAVDHVIFTGSIAGGKSVRRAAAGSFIDCGLELGGKDAAYVAPDADLNEAARGVVDGAMYNAGQSCCGIERLYVHEAVYAPFLEKCAALVESYRLGDPLHADTTLGPLAKAAAAEKMMSQINEAVARGAEIVRGGHIRKIGSGTFFEPTLLTGVTNDMAVMREENFGPILPVMKVSDMDEAVRLINDSKYGLTAAIYTASEELADRFSENVEAGTLFMNRCDYLDPALPWTGVKESGKGSALSKYGFYAVTRRKSIHFRRQF